MDGARGPEHLTVAEAEVDAGSSWDDEDVKILWQATARADALMRDLARGRDSQPDVEALLDYLREVVLTRISDEDRHVLPVLRRARPDAPELAELQRQHLQLRSDVDDLAAGAQGHVAREGLAGVIRRLVDHLEIHLATEAAVLHRDQDVTAEERAWVAASHWYPLIEGPVIEMDRLRADQAESAVLNRLTRLRPGEQVELRSGREPHAVWVRLQQRDPGAHDWQAKQDDAGWSVTVRRRGP
jgi:uncharacterized protein (DUF2249 family)